MSNDDPCAELHTSTDKGKRRAATPEPSESTALLPSSSSHTIHQSHHHVSPPELPRHHSLVRRLIIVFSATLVACVVVLVLILLFALSYSSRVSDLTAHDVLDRGLFIEGPDRVDVLNVTKEGGVWVSVDCRVGLDMGGILGVRPDEGDLVWTELWKGIGRWGVGKVGRITIEPAQITVTSRSEPPLSLAVLTAPVIELPLSPDPPSGLEWLTPMSIPINIRPTNHTEDLVLFANESWLSGVIQVSATIPSIHVTGGGVHEDTWRNRFSTERSNVPISICTTIPQLPGLPKPGNNRSFPPLSHLLNLKTFHIFSDLDQLRVNASATFPTPLPDPVQLTIPSLPFVVSVPHHPNDTLANDIVPVVHVETAPLTLTHPNTTVHVRGRVAALQHDTFPLLSGFVTSYLNGESPRIFLSTPLLHDIAVETVFPAPDPRPQVLRNVTVKDMKIRPLASGTMLASGTVFARIVLPRGMDMLLQVDAVYPQLLIYDGPVPDDESIGMGVLGEDEDDDLPEPMPLPDPLPTNAFAHIRPGEWLDSISVPLGHQEGEGSVFAVSARIVDIPLEVLPGRQREFSNFVGKVIFGGGNGALAGISGTTAVRIIVSGLGEDGVQLEGLPFSGDIRVGKKAMLDIENS